MGFGDYLSNVYNNTANDIGGAYGWLTGNKGDAAAKDDRSYLNGFMDQGNPYISARGPQQGNYNSLIQMLQARANGSGPSIAGDAYKQAAADNQSRLQTMSYGSSPGAARAAVQQMGNVGQGLAQGYGAARNSEMVGATGQLTGAIGAADQSQLARDRANQEAWLQMMMQRLGLTKAQMGGKTNMDILGGLIKGGGEAAAMPGGGAAGAAGAMPLPI